MKLTGGDSRDLMAWGAGGLAAGCLYQITAIWAKQKTNVQDLSPATEALCDDSELFALFCQLQEYRTVSELHFRRAVDSADRLLFLHAQLRSEKVQATLSDRPNAFLYLKYAVFHLEALFDKAQAHPISRVPVEIHRLYVLIFESMEKHWNAILHLTQRIATI